MRADVSRLNRLSRLCALNAEMNCTIIIGQSTMRYIAMTAQKICFDIQLMTNNNNALGHDTKGGKESRA